VRGGGLRLHGASKSEEEGSGQKPAWNDEGSHFGVSVSDMVRMRSA
jgi:hypothetical protein